MVRPDELSPALRGKALSAQLLLAQAIMEAGRSRRFPLADEDRMTLGQFIARIQQKRIVDETLLLAVSKIVRNYEQHLIALARSVR